MTDSTSHDAASVILSAMRVDLNAHTGYTLAAIAADAATTTAARSNTLNCWFTA